MPPAGAPLFSIVVPFLNEERWLPICIPALEAQQFPAENFEILFVDNGSTDQSAAIIARHPRVRLLHESRKDPYLARNRAIAEARGEYIVFLDADCIPDPDWLSQFHASLTAQPADIVLGYLSYPRNASALVRAYEYNYDTKLQYMLRHRMVPNYFGHGGNMIVRTEVFRKHGPFVPMPVVGDTEIIHRLFTAEPNAVITYARRARVEHAEVTASSVWLYKMYESGKYSETLVQAGGFQPLPLAHRLRILSLGIREHRLGLFMTAATVVMILSGWAAFGFGRAVRR